jgi:hypothetical protein
VTGELDDIIEQTLQDGLGEAGVSAILRRLDIELQHQVEVSALGGQTPEAWVVGGVAAGGFGSMSERFIAFYAAAFRRELCDAEGVGLKPRYTELLRGQDLPDQIKLLVPAILTSLADSVTWMVPLTVAMLVALWLVRVGLEQWCAQSQVKIEDRR